MDCELLISMMEDEETAVIVGQVGIKILAD